jgi:hypothetical protein
MLNYRILYKESKRFYDRVFIDEVREYKPCKRTVNIGGSYFFLPFPYMIFCSRFDSGYFSSLDVFFATRRYKATKLNQKIYVPCLPNINNSGRVCLYSEGERGYKRYLRNTDDVISSFWSRGFCSYIGMHCDFHARNSLMGITKQCVFDMRCVEIWESLSIRSFINRLKKVPTDFTCSRIPRPR